MLKLLLTNGMIVADHSVEQKDILIEDQEIIKVGKGLSDPADKVIDLHGLAVFPGLVDMHVHLRDPGLTYKSDIYTGCCAAAAGGVTSVACMPNTKPAIDSPETIQYIVDKASTAKARVYPIASVTKGLEGSELVDFAALKEAGAVAFSDDGRPVENAAYLQRAMEAADKLGTRVISHCEDLAIIDGGIINKGQVSEQLGVKGMDRTSEDSITAREIAIAAATHTPIHIAHVSTRGSVALIRDAKRRGVRVTAETCPHYFILTEEQLLKKDADYRMNPPLREEKDRQAIVEGIIDGTIDCIVTDHAPHAPKEKLDFETAPNGVIGLETSMAATLTSLYHTGRLTLERIAQLMSGNPARILGIPGGQIAPGRDADIAVVNLHHKWTVDPDKLHSKSKNTVFKGMTFTGKPVMTICRGEIVYNELDQ